MSNEATDNQLANNNISVVSICEDIDRNILIIDVSITSHNGMSKSLKLRPSELTPRRILKLADYGLLVKDKKEAEKICNDLKVEVSKKIKEDVTKALISRYGWVKHGSQEEYRFVPYDDVVKCAIPDGHPKIVVCEQASLEIWKDNVTAICSKSPTLRLVLATATASLLVERLGQLPFVLNLYGTSGCGKTLALKIAASLFASLEVGDYIKCAYSTPAYLDSLISTLHSFPLLLDETSESRRSYESLVMRITEGASRGRMGNNNKQQISTVFHNATIITGESSIVSPTSSDGIRNRLVECEVSECEPVIPNDVDKKILIDTLRKNYGVAGKELVEYIKNLGEDIHAEFHNKLNSIHEARVDVTGKLETSMALILLADQINCECLYDSQNLTPWEPNNVSQYVRAKTNYVNQLAIEAVFYFINSNQHQFAVRSDKDKSKEAKGANAKSNIIGRINSLQELKDDNNNLVQVVKEVDVDYDTVIKVLEEHSYSFDALKKKWKADKFIQGNSQGRYCTTTSINNIPMKVVTLDFSKVSIDGYSKVASNCTGGEIND